MLLKMFMCGFKRLSLWLVLMSAIVLGGCHDDDLKSRVDDLENRVVSLEKLCAEMNTNISSMQGLVEALRERDYVTGVVPVTENGLIIGYTITFGKSEPVTVFNGKSGISLSASEDSDGEYYWQLGGDWLLDLSGKKMSVSGTTPLLKVEDGYWYISVDKGNTWREVGKASSDDDAFFRNIDNSASDHVDFVLSDGTVITLPKQVITGMLFSDTLPLITAGETIEIDYILLDYSEKTLVKTVVQNGWKAIVKQKDASTGSITITAPSPITDDEVLVFVTDGKGRTDMYAIGFTIVVLEGLDNDTINVSGGGGDLHLQVTSNVSVEMLPEEPWIQYVSVPDSKALETNLFYFEVQPNEGEESRSGNILMKDAGGKVLKTIRINQGNVYDEILAKERKALIEFYHTANGDKWLRNDNWCSDRPVGEWYGITTNQQGCVIEIRLYGIRMTGVLSPAIGDFAYLEILDLSTISGSEDPNNNQLTGNIPAEIGNLSQLFELNLSCNQFEGEIPKELGNLENLRVLNLAHNTLAGSIPEELGNLSNLMYLYLYSNELTGEIPSSLGKLLNLCGLDLMYNQLSGNIPLGLFMLKKLDSFILSNNQLTGGIPSEIGNLTELNTIWLGSNRLSGSIPSSIGKLTKLKQLDLSGNCFTGTIPKEIGNMVALESFDIGNYSAGAGGGTITPGEPVEEGNGISGPIPVELCRLPNLQNFSAIGCNLSGDIPDEIWSMPSLRTLALPENQLSGKISPAIGNAKNLVQLWLNNNLLTGPLPDELCELSNLEELLLGNSTNELSGEDMQNYNHFEGSLPSNIGNMKKLRQLRLSNTGLTGEIPASICQLENLEELSLGNYGGKVGNSFSGLIPTDIGKMKRLYTFDIMNNNIEGSIPAGFVDLPQLTNLWLAGNRLQGLIPRELSNSPKWSMWDPYMNIFPQQDGYVLSIDYYVSTDFSADGEILELQRSSRENGVDVVLLGDGFADVDMVDGTYDRVMNKAMENFFSVEPTASLRDYFNVYAVRAVSLNQGIGGETVFNTRFGDGTEITGDDNRCMEYAQKIPGIDLSETLILVVLNDERYAGTSYMYNNNLGIAYCPIVGGLEDEQFAQIIHHEAIGHGFAKLADEYYYDGNNFISAEEVAFYSSQKLNGWWANADFTSDPTVVSWNAFISDERYQPEGIGVYEGAFTYPRGAYRSTENSIMRYNTGGFNAPSRESIYKRIVELAGEAYSRDKFIDYDAINRTPAAVSVRAAQIRSAERRKFTPLHPPVILQYNH